MPLSGSVMPLVLEAHRDAVAVESPEILDQPIVEFPHPFTGEERDDCCAAFKEFGAIAPDAVLGIGRCDAFGVTRIPGVFGHAGFLGGGFPGERRQRGTRHGDLGFFVRPRLYRREWLSRWRFAYHPIAKSHRPSAAPATPWGSAAPAPR